MKYSLFFLIALALVLATDGHTSWFCNGIENDHLPEGCTLEEALEFHRASEADHEKAREFVGEVHISNATEWTSSGSGFLFQTKNCKDNNLVFTNAHVFFENETGESRGNGGKFCLVDKCYFLDMSESSLKKMGKAGLIGDKKDLLGKEQTKDFIILPLKNPVKFKSKKVVELTAFRESKHQNQKIKLAAQYNNKREVRVVHNCEVTGYGGFFDENQEGGLSILHNCPTQKGFSGAPIVYNNKIIAVHSARGRGESGKNYDSWGNFNSGLPITEELILNLDRFCSGLKPYTPSELIKIRQKIRIRKENEEKARERAREKEEIAKIFKEIERKERARAKLYEETNSLKPYTILFMLYLFFLITSVVGATDKVRFFLARQLSKSLSSKEKALSFSKKLNLYLVTGFSKSLSKGILRKNPHATSTTLEGVDLFSNILLYAFSMIITALLLASPPMIVLAIFTFVI